MMLLLLAATALLCGCLSVLTQATAPELLDWLLLLATLLSAWFIRSASWRVIIVFFCLGFLCCYYAIDNYLDQRVKEQQAHHDFEISGTIRGAVSNRDYAYSFDIDIDWWRSIDGLSVPAPPRLRIYWYQKNIEPQTGERIHAIVRIKPPLTKHSGTAFYEEAYALSRQRYGSGYIREILGRETVAPHDWRAMIDRLRFGLSERIAALDGSAEAKAIVNGLANGDRRAISGSLWQLLNRTGTSHLMAISGLHIGMFALCAWRLLLALMVAWPGSWIFAHRWVLTITTLALSFIYALFCGMSLPTQRALLMLTAFMIAQLFARARSPLRALLVAFIAVLLWQPVAVISPGLWLSFLAVAFLLVSNSSIARTNTWFRWLYLQTGISLFLLPVCIYWFGQAALSANLANLVAIPMVCFVILPLVWLATLIGLLSMDLQEWLFKLCFEFCDMLVALLRQVIALPQSYILLPQMPSWSILLACLGLLISFSVPVRSLRLAGLLLCLPLFNGDNSKVIERGQAELAMIDVGQGLAMTIDSRQRTLLYDTGPEYRGGTSAGGRIVAPWLERHGRHRLDRVLVSHLDNDHAGGLAQILERLPVGDLVSNNQRAMTHYLRKRGWNPETKTAQAADDEQRHLRVQNLPAQHSCQELKHWQWDGVRFDIIWPTAEAADYSRNNRSCVLWLRTAHLSALILGDIDMAIEKRLIELYPELRANILVIAHHGSAYSTSSALLDHLNPNLALISAGYLNRWSMPAASVLQRLRQAGVPWLSTAAQGTIKLSLVGKHIRILTQTGRRHRYWHRPRLPEPIPCRPIFIYNQCTKLSQPGAGSPGSLSAVPSSPFR